MLEAHFDLLKASLYLLKSLFIKLKPLFVLLKRPLYNLYNLKGVFEYY